MAFRKRPAMAHGLDPEPSRIKPSANRSKSFVSVNNRRRFGRVQGNNSSAFRGKKLLGTGLQAAFSGQDIYNAGGPVLTIDSGTMTARAFHAHVIVILLAKVTAISIRMSIATKGHKINPSVLAAYTEMLARITSPI